MRKEDKIEVNGIQITIKELTVAEVRHWMMDMNNLSKSTEGDNSIETVIDLGLFEGFSLSDIMRMTDLTKEKLDDFKPSQIRLIAEKCEEVNPDFFGLRRKIHTVVTQNV